MMLEIGPGDFAIPGYTHYMDRKNVKVPGELVIHEIMNFPWPFQNDIFDSVTSIHCLEHFTFTQGLHILKEIRRILAPNGVCQIHVPNITQIMLPFLITSNIDAKTRLMDLIFGSEVNSEVMYAHKVVYDTTLLQYQFEQAGFRGIRNITSEIIDRHDGGYRDIDVWWASLKMIGIK